MKFMPGTPKDVMDRELARWRSSFGAGRGRAGKKPKGRMKDMLEAVGYGPGVEMGPGPESFTPNRGSTNPEYGSAIGRGGLASMVFMDSDRDGVDDRFQRGPGQPRESGGMFGKGKNKSPEKTIINRDPVSNPPMLGAMSGAAAGIAGAAGNLTKKKPEEEAASSAAANAPLSGASQTPRSGGGGRRAGRREGRRQAGMNFGLMPTEVIEQTRGRGYGLTYQPQQRTGKQIKFGGGGPQNVINFNPIMSQQANPNIRIGVGGSKQVSRPTQTSSPIQESGPGSVYTGPNTGNFEEGRGNQTQPIFTPPPAPPVLLPPPPPPPKGEDKPVKTSEPKPGGTKNKYRKLMDRYMRKFDRTAYGAGSKKGTDRFSGLDIRKMVAAGRKFGGSRKAVAKDVIAYADRYRGKTKMGGTSRKELDKLQAILGKSREAAKKRKSKAAKEQRKKDKKQSKKASRAAAKAKANAFKSGRKRGGVSNKKRGGKRGGKRGRRR